MIVDDVRKGVRVVKTLRKVLPPVGATLLLILSAIALLIKKRCRNRKDAPTSSPTSDVPSTPTLETPIRGT